MKLALMWGLAIGWFLVFGYLAVDAFTQHTPILAWGRMKWVLEVLAGIGALTLGLAPVVAAATVHHVHRRRLRHRLEKQKAKIEKRLARLDERRGGSPPPRPPQALPPASGATPLAPSPGSDPGAPLGRR